MLRVFAGGGLGRTPILSSLLREDLPWEHLLTYVEAILRVYNRYGRRDNKYKARIKILVKAIGAEAFAAEVDQEWQHLKDGPATLTDDEYERVAGFFRQEGYEALPGEDTALATAVAANRRFGHWVKRNVRGHSKSGYAAVTLSTKPGSGTPPGDVTADQMDRIAMWAEQYGFG
jgi:sulfite reductase (NADPH) hemoprotein beta-component